jgi:hypothetical protein
MRPLDTTKVRGEVGQMLRGVRPIGDCYIAKIYVCQKKRKDMCILIADLGGIDRNDLERDVNAPIYHRVFSDHNR